MITHDEIPESLGEKCSHFCSYYDGFHIRVDEVLNTCIADEKIRSLIIRELLYIEDSSIVKEMIRTIKRIVAWQNFKESEESMWPDDYLSDIATDAERILKKIEKEKSNQ